ncbi:hypothetical protein [Streptomyces sp. NPDC060035]|uniref:hypothetical protein n=1 Tax=Streptomyces sp. NPDC060035 TaxID=3347044 RepID=UPI003680027E
MPGDHPVAPGRKPSKGRSDLDDVRAWWRALGGEGFVALPPPTRSRYTQSDGHEDAAELFGTRGLGAGTSFVYWHWQSQQAFDRSGALIGELMLHWGGDHAVVAARLGGGPTGYQVIDGGPQGAFRLDRVTQRDSTGMPGPEDPAGIRQFLEEIDTPVGRRRLPYTYRPLAGSEAGWLHDRLRAPMDLTAAGRFVTSLERRDALTYDEAVRLLPAWREGYAGRLTKWAGWSALLHALLRHDHEQVWETVAAVGPKAAGILGEVPSERGLTVVRALALAGERAAIPAWLTLHQAIREPDWVSAAGSLAAEMTDHDAPDASVRALFSALSRAVTAAWLRGSGAAYPADLSCAALAAVRFSTDERLPRRLRVVAADTARERVAALREEATRLGPAYAELTGTSATDALAAADRFEAARAELLAGTGPDLTAYEGALRDVWHRYRMPTDVDIGWLRAQVAEPRTELQGLGFCLELLYAHGAATDAEVDALLPRWKKVLTKQYRTTYTEWRHPMVTWTCMALDLGHPVAAELLAWWTKPKPLWKNDLRLLTHLGAPDESKAVELWEFIASGAHDTGHLMTWVLMRARLDGVPPLQVADRLLCESGLSAYVLHRVLIGVADPAQPLWHYSVNARSWDWWRRAQQVADDASLSASARAIGLDTARGHYLFRYPDQVRPAPTKADLATARAWIDQHSQ